MNNRYIFRGKGNPRYNDGEWYYGHLIYDGSDYQIVDSEYGSCKRTVIAETVGQCTGLKDKNDKWIFENDIVTMPAYRGGRTNSVVYFKNGKFAVDGSNYAFKDICPRNMEVIGNIHDNSELLEVER